MHQTVSIHDHVVRPEISDEEVLEIRDRLRSKAMLYLNQVCANYNGTCTFYLSKRIESTSVILKSKNLKL